MNTRAKVDARLTETCLPTVAALALTLLPATPLVAQQDASKEQLMLEEVTVTATRRGELIQDVPLSVSAFTKQKIEHEGIVTFEDYGVRIPNLAFSPSNSTVSTNALSIAIRGVSGGTTTGFYIDDTPLPQSLNPKVIDMERIEVLRGPQGTLYGARSLGGTVRLITTQPDTQAFSGSLHGAVGSITDGDESYQADATFNVPLSDDAAMRMTAYAQSIGGFIDIEPADGPYISGDPSTPLLSEALRDINSSNIKGAQLAARFEFLEDRLSITPRIMYENAKYDGRTQVDLTDSKGLSDRRNGRFFDIPEESEDEWTLGTLTIAYEADFGQFTSASSWFDRQMHDAEDAAQADAGGALTGAPGQPILPFLGFPEGSVSPVIISVDANVDSFTQEFRFTSDWDGPLQLTAGLFYQKLDTDFEFPPTALPPIPIEAIDLFNETGTQSTKEQAAFAELTYSFNDRFQLILGGRYFDNSVDITSFQGGTFGNGLNLSESQSEDGTTFRFGGKYQIDADQMFYATVSEGYRIGGANTLPVDVCEAGIIDAGLDPDSITFFDSDDLTSSELGYKSTLAGGRVRLNAALFHIEWADIQQTVSFPCGFGAGINAGKAEIEGGELELDMLLAEGLNLAVGVGYNDSEIINNNGIDELLPIGSSVQNVPEWTLNGALDWRFNVSELPLFAYLSFTHVGDSEGRRQFGVDVQRKAYDLVNFRLGADFENYTVTLFVENLTDEAADFGNKPPLALDTPGLKRISVNYPRTFWLDFRYRF